MSTKNRPLSPHLSAYKFNIGSTMSIMHRLTGVAMSVGTLLLDSWLIATASGPQGYDHFASIAGSLLGKLAIAGWVFGFYYHFANGIRHLFWDAGKGFELSQARASGITVALLSGLATVITWFLLFG